MSNLIKVIVMLGGLVSSALWAGEEAARDTVVGVVDSFRTDIIADKAELANNPELLAQRIDKILTPVIDFDDFAKKVMGKYYRRATPDQRERFATVTRDTLLKTYGGSLLELDPDKIKILPLGPQRKGREVKVDVDFQMADGSPLNLNFFMEDYGSDNWKLSNVVINNINFGLTFRKQFAVMMQQNKNKIDAAIDAWKLSLEKKS
ncbi:MlaC/ttg2D family ABC transporter substrate-binding protein [Marinomonas pollencensis]|uniref:Phospholipid transport system substrate-binding protein n=1 Tax=Marinomonas pollencensis TaxID=491954 RepID=A0A3E0DGG1_9GAMM|nr:ABC transporter substrate-binding protein [Marinomonas pollencensis]REG81775.1 phospholipid transport system substrate-binding protein [Marinomonas pollencensis]